jgi:hypothetical protein
MVRLDFYWLFNLVFYYQLDRRRTPLLSRFASQHGFHYRKPLINLNSIFMDRIYIKAAIFITRSVERQEMQTSFTLNNICVMEAASLR